MMQSQNPIADKRTASRDSKGGAVVLDGEGCFVVMAIVGQAPRFHVGG